MLNSTIDVTESHDLPTSDNSTEVVLGFTSDSSITFVANGVLYGAGMPYSAEEGKYIGKLKFASKGTESLVTEEVLRNNDNAIDSITKILELEGAIRLQVHDPEYSTEASDRIDEDVASQSNYKRLLSRLKSINSQAEERLRELTSLEPDWDGYGGAPPTSRATEMSALILTIALGITKGKLQRPAISSLSDGGIELEWMLQSGYELLIDIGPDGRYVDYLLIEPTESGEREIEGVIPKDSSMSELLDRLIE